MATNDYIVPLDLLTPSLQPPGHQVKSNGQKEEGVGSVEKADKINAPCIKSKKKTKNSNNNQYDCNSNQCPDNPFQRSHNRMIYWFNKNVY